MRKGTDIFLSFYRYFIIIGSPASYSPWSWPTTHYDLKKTLRSFTPSSLARRNLTIRASYLTLLLKALKPYQRAYFVMTPFGLAKMSTTPHPYKFEVSSILRIHYGTFPDPLDYTEDDSSCLKSWWDGDRCLMGAYRCALWGAFFEIRE